MTTHVAFVKKHWVGEIIARRKRVEVRLSRRLTGAWSCRSGDVVLFKEVGGRIRARARAHVERLHLTSSADVFRIYRRIKHALGEKATEEYFVYKCDARYAVLIWLSSVEPVSLPMHLTPVGVREGWVADFQFGHHARKETNS